MTEEKDLGVYIDEQLKFHVHVAKAVGTASRMLELVRHTFICLDRITGPLLFKTMVRPHLEYGNVIWHPRFRRDRLEVEKVQRRATRLVTELRHLPYQERLQALRLPSLEHRRRRGDIIEVWNIVKGVYRLDHDKLFVKAEDSATRGHKLKLRKEQSRLDVRLRWFSQRAVNDWNALPAHVIAGQTVITFKSRLDAHWRNFRYALP